MIAQKLETWYMHVGKWWQERDVWTVIQRSLEAITCANSGN